MSNLFTLTLKQVKIFIKTGVTPEEVCKRYDCTEGELKEKLKRFYQGNEKKVHELYAELEANRKKPRCKKTAEAEETAPKEPAIETENSEPVPDVVPENPEPSVEATDLVSSLSLEDLFEEEKVLSGQLVSNEQIYRGFLHERHALKGKLRDLLENLEEIESVLNMLQKDKEALVSEINDLGNKANNIGSFLREKTVALEKVRHEIEQKRKITLYVYKDGTIEATDNPDFVLDDNDYLELKEELIKMEACENLRIRDITTLARLLRISEKTDSEPLLVCEIPELETAFWTIRGA